MAEKIEKYDIILAGAGLSGLTMAHEMMRHYFFQEKKILLIDRDDKNKNDRTWCFWAKPGEPLPPVVFKTWEQCLFFGHEYQSVLTLNPYRYHMIRGADFYDWAKKELAQHAQITWLKADIQAIDFESGIIKTSLKTVQADWVINSAFTAQKVLPTISISDYKAGLSTWNDRPDPSLEKYVWLLQHFKGWVIETHTDSFDPDLMTLMDYRIDQKGETRFVYVLPLSPTRALVEFTVFSSSLCPMAEYDSELASYMNRFLNIKDYAIIEEEFGIIPMSDYPFSPTLQGRVLNIGTAAGFVKASSGYAFLRTQRKIRQLAKNWAENGRPHPAVARSPLRFRLYDATLLKVLKEGSVSGKQVFTDMFQKRGAAEVFKFLDEDTNFFEELMVMNSVPVGAFSRAAIERMRYIGSL
jgi:lycopene beta-cyclase